MSAACLLLLLLASDPGVPIQMIVTAEGHRGHQPPELTAGDVQLSQGKNRLPIREVAPLRGGLQLALMIDDGSDADISLQFGDLRKFIDDQPATMQIGVYYMRNGTAVPVHPMTADHAAAGKSLRLPIGEAGVDASPYLALSDLIKKWPATQDRREVLMITNGLGLYRGTPEDNPYLASAIRDAQRARVLVHSIYFAGAGHFGHSFSRISFGRDNLSYLADGTGGECYWEGLSTSTSFAPYLDDLAVRLNHQYLVTATAEPAKKAELQHLKLHTELPHVDLIGPDQVWVPSGK